MNELQHFGDESKDTMVDGQAVRFGGIIFSTKTMHQIVLLGLSLNRIAKHQRTPSVFQELPGRDKSPCRPKETLNDFRDKNLWKTPMP